MPHPKFFFCATCHGQRLHESKVKCDKLTSKLTRQLACSACATVTPIGLCCPAAGCGDARLRVVYTRQRGGATVRVRRCMGCGRRTPTREVIEAFSA